jgi:hypothetical protein
MDLILKIKCEEMPWLVYHTAAVPRPLLQQQAAV